MKLAHVRRYPGKNVTLCGLQAAFTPLVNPTVSELPPNVTLCRRCVVAFERLTEDDGSRGMVSEETSEQGTSEGPGETPRELLARTLREAADLIEAEAGRG